MVYIDSEELKWTPYVKTWITRLGKKVPKHPDNRVIILLFFSIFSIFIYIFFYCCFVVVFLFLNENILPLTTVSISVW